MRTYEVLEEHEQDSPQWHEARRGGIGASEVAAILGLSKWQTPLDVYRAKKGVPNEIDPNRAYFGHALEPVIAGWLTRAHRSEVGFVGSGFSARSVEWPWLTASPDRIASAPDFVGPIPVELKTSSAYVRASWQDGIPLYYQAQVQTQLAVLGAPRGWLAVLHDGNQPELYPVDRDEEFIRDLLVPETRTFWEAYVLADVPPEPSTSAEAVEMWPGDPGAAPVEATDEAFRLWQELVSARDRKVQAESDIDLLTLELQKELGDATELVHDGRTLATWKPQAGARRLDTAALKHDHPEMAALYTTQGAATRRFIVKAQKEVHA